MSVAIILFIAVLLDQLLGEPVRFHPLVGFGKVASYLEKLVNKEGKGESIRIKRCYGLMSVIVLVAPISFIVSYLEHIPDLGGFFSAILLYLSLGQKSLVKHAVDVAKALKDGNLKKARICVGLIVSRQTTDMQPQDVARATIESVLENGNDAVLGAVFWWCILGTPGVVTYRLINTLDAMWGYKNERYLHFGWAAARLDDALNLLPARLTAFTYALFGNTRAALKCWQQQGTKWYSPNAGPVMAAGAGALGLLLGGPAIYHGLPKERLWLGQGRNPDWRDIERAITMVRRGLWLWMAILFAGGATFA